MDVFQHIKGHIDLPEYVRNLGCTLRSSGADKYTTNCPLPGHEDSTPSFEISIGNNGFWRYTCYARCQGDDLSSGDIFDMHQLLNKNLQTIKEVQDDLAGIYGLDISNFTAPKRDYSDIYEAKKRIQDEMHKKLLENQTALNKLIDRGITKDDVVKFKIGLTFPNMSKYFMEVFKDHIKGINDQMIHLVECGLMVLPHKSKQIVPAGCFKENRFTIPCIHEGKISHWRFRGMYGKSGGLQMKKEVCMKDCFFYNQGRLKEDDFFLVEGEFDAISLEKQGFSAVAMCGYSKEKLDYIAGLKKYDENFPEINTKKTIRIAFDRDTNGSGQKRSNLVGSYLSSYFDVVIYELPMGKDIDEYIRDGGNVQDLPSKVKKPEESNIRIDRGRYWFQPKAVEAPAREITNFVIDKSYEYIHRDGRAKYQVNLVRYSGERVNGVRLEGKDYKSIQAFKEWLAYIPGGYSFMGTAPDLDALVQYFNEFLEPQRIQMVNSYGHYKQGTWLSDSGVMVEGDLIESDSAGVTFLDGVDGIKPSLDKDLSVSYRFPTDMWEVSDIVKNIFKFYPRNWVWYIFGFASALYHHEAIRSHMRQFPVAGMVGKTNRGKTSLAELICSLFGASKLTGASSQSTAKGIARLMSSMHSIPVIVNEYEQKKMGRLIRAVYDGDSDITGMKTLGDEVMVRNYNTSLIITTENIPASVSVLNRLVYFDFFGFTPSRDPDVQREFSIFEDLAITGNRNFGWLKAMNSAEDKGDIIEDIDKARDMLIKSEAKADGRFLKNNSIIFGALRNMFKRLKMVSMLKNIGITPPDQTELLECFLQSANRSKEMMATEDPLRNFFMLFEKLYVTGQLKNYAKEMTDPDMGRALVFNVTHVLIEVQKEDNRAGKKLEVMSESDLRRLLDNRFKEKTSKKTRYMGDGKSMATIMIPLTDITQSYDVSFDEYGLD